LMLIVVITVFLTTEIPLMVITVLHTLSNKYGTFYLYFLRLMINLSFSFSFIDYNAVKNIILIINAFICFSYPLNFAIYCGMSR
jgi:hypothetical protein